MEWVKQDSWFDIKLPSSPLSPLNIAVFAFGFLKVSQLHYTNCKKITFDQSRVIAGNFHQEYFDF